ncbi:MAG: ATP-binding protein [Clostridia bacterium]|nr:ATP-binding protein [Clostridia bacterium]
MVKLIVGIKGSGKTKALIGMVNDAVEKSNGSVVCVEKGIKLRYDVNYNCRLINVDEYFVFGSRQLYGFLAGLIASNHDISDLFVDSALRICDNNIDTFERMVNDIDELADRYKVNVVMTSSMPVEDLTDGLKKFVN